MKLAVFFMLLGIVVAGLIAAAPNLHGLGAFGAGAGAAFVAAVCGMIAAKPKKAGGK